MKRLRLWMGAYSRGGGVKRGGTYEVIVDIKKTLLKELVYFRRDLFISIKLIITKNLNICGNSIKRRRQPQMTKIIKLRGRIREFTVAVGA